MTVHKQPYLPGIEGGERADDPVPLSSKPRLRLVDGNTGEIVCDDCGRANDRAQDYLGKLEDAERELRQYRAKVRFLMNEKQRERDNYVRRAEVASVFEEWKVRCRHPQSKLTPDRFDAIQKILEWGYTPDHISAAVGYVALFPFVVDAVRAQRGKPSQRFDDIELVCRSGSKFERFANLGAYEERQQRLV